MGKILGNYNRKNAGIVTLISDKMLQNITRDKEGSSLMIMAYFIRSKFSSSLMAYFIRRCNNFYNIHPQ